MDPLALAVTLEEVRESYRSGKTRSSSWRRAQLEALLQLLQDKEEDIFSALNQDLGKHHVEAFRDELGVLIKSVDLALQSLNKWMAPRRIRLPLAVFPSSGEVVPEPFGVVLIFSSWNFPIGLALEPLIGAISAGNSVVLKTSELASASSNFLANNIPLYLDKRAVKVIQGGPQAGEQLLEQKWDKIFFTGSMQVGRIIMTAAAKHLTPVTLELGGKCPAIVDSLLSSRDKKVAIRRIVGGKWSACSGQACIGVDYLLVEEEFAPALVDLVKQMVTELYVKSEYISRIVNKQHFQRLSNLLKDPLVTASIVHGGTMDSENLSIEPTILVDPPLDSDIMTEEIFGPLLPVITVKKIEDSIGFINARPKPLAIYAFTCNEKLKRQIVSETSSGSVTFNDTMIQFICDALPFGGVGQSGFGKYHGKFSFDTFSHEKAVLRRSFLIDFTFRYPPWNEDKLQLMRYLYSFNYFRFLLKLLGLK